MVVREGIGLERREGVVLEKGEGVGLEKREELERQVVVWRMMGVIGIGMNAVAWLWSGEVW